MNACELQDVRQLISNTTEPLIIRNVLKWECLNWNLAKWTSLLGSEKLPYRSGKNSYTKKPQFENTTKVVCMTFKEFLAHQEKSKDEWYYFDYKYLREWFRHITELHQYIKWADLGFPGIDAEDSTIWIGSKGAHTPCHVDTYGCNLIAQVYGSKRWMLFPPNSNLYPTRVPYEESSVYSKLNFFSPCLEDFHESYDCRSVVLNPGDVLVVPHKWWHYVENLNLAISINTWLERPEDDEERVKESIVRLLVAQLAKNMRSRYCNLILNPKNSVAEATVVEESTEDAMAVTNICLRKFKARQIADEIDVCDVEDILQDFDNIEVLKPLPDESLKTLLQQQRERFEPCIHVNQPEDDEESIIRKIVDSLLHDDVINVIKTKLLED